MRKGLTIMSVLIFVILAGLAFVIVWVAVNPTSTGTTTNGGTLDLSFKPFTLNELLHNKTKVDLATSGKRIHSAKFVQIEAQTSKIRGLPLKNQVPLVEASEGLIKYQLIQSSLDQKSIDQTVASEKILKAMGLLKPTDNLSTILTDVLTEQIAGSYDPETKEITIVKGKGLGSATDEITMSHEVTHALQDQNFGLTKPPLENKAYNSDEDTGVQSLVEGDATDTMYEYAKTYMTYQQVLQVQQESTTIKSPQLDKAPLYIRRGLLFPYDTGLSFVQGIKSDAGGEPEVDNALRNPPLSTQLIMHPSLFPSGQHQPKPVTLPDITTSLGKGWKQIDNDTLGEFDIQIWFEQFVDKATGDDVGDGWSGNTVQYYQGPGKNYVFPNETVWLVPEDAQLFFNDYVKLLQSRFGSALKKVGSTQTSYLYQAGPVFFYAGINGSTTLALQATSRDMLNKALANYTNMAPAQ